VVWNHMGAVIKSPAVFAIDMIAFDANFIQTYELHIIFYSRLHVWEAVGLSSLDQIVNPIEIVWQTKFFFTNYLHNLLSYSFLPHWNVKKIRSMLWAPKKIWFSFTNPSDKSSFTGMMMELH